MHSVHWCTLKPSYIDWRKNILSILSKPFRELIVKIFFSRLIQFLLFRVHSKFHSKEFISKESKYRKRIKP